MQNHAVKIRELMGKQGRETTLKNFTSDTCEQKKHRNLIKMVARFYMESAVLKRTHLTINMTVHLGKDLKVACGGTCGKDCYLSCEQVGLLLVIPNQMERLSTRCEWVWFTIHLGDLGGVRLRALWVTLRDSVRVSTVVFIHLLSLDDKTAHKQM